MKKQFTDDQRKIQDEKALAVLMQKGTESQKQIAFNQLYKNNKEALLFKQLIARFHMDKEEARDAMQEIFMKVFKNIHMYSTEYAFSTWLYKIAYNHVVDMKRQKNFEVLNIEVLQVGSNETAEDSGGAKMVFQLEDHSDNNHELLVKKERAEMIRKAIETIKHKNARKIINKFFIQDKSHEDISKEMNLPIGTIKALIFRGKEVMKTYLSIKHPDFEYGRICKTTFKTASEIQNS